MSEHIVNSICLIGRSSTLDFPHYFIPHVIQSKSNHSFLCEETITQLYREPLLLSILILIVPGPQLIECKIYSNCVFFSFKIKTVFDGVQYHLTVFVMSWSSKIATPLSHVLYLLCRKFRTFLMLSSPHLAIILPSLMSRIFFSSFAFLV